MVSTSEMVKNFLYIKLFLQCQPILNFSGRLTSTRVAVLPCIISGFEYLYSSEAELTECQRVVAAAKSCFREPGIKASLSDGLPDISNLTMYGTIMNQRSFRIGDFEAALLQLDTFALDGGAMFGIIPKAIWSHLYHSNEENGITLCSTSLLVRVNNQHILVETGVGSKLTDKEKRHVRFMPYQSPLQALQPFALTPQDIDWVILTHLHFDHAGGSTKMSNNTVKPVFPNARYVVQQEEFEVACATNERTAASYHSDDFLPLQEAGNLTLVDGDREIVPGVRVVKTGGHTQGHQVVFFESNGKGAIHIGDLVPTSTHLPLPYIMGYDTHPLITLEMRKKLYREIREKKLRVIFPHDMYHTIASPADVPVT